MRTMINRRTQQALANTAFALLIALPCAYVSAADSKQYFRFDGALTEDRLGVSVGRLGDVDDDGFADILTGARYADVDGRTDTGSVYVFSGKDGHQIYRFNGEGAGDWFGVAVAGIGDVNGDGRPDILVGAQFATRDDGAQTGGAYVYSGADGRLLYLLFGDNADGRFGVSVSGGYDVDGDGVNDFVVGSYLENAAYIYSGRTGTLITKLTGAPATWYGFAVALLPDLNGDGRAEIAVSAPQAGGPGAVTVYSGLTRNVLYILNGAQNGDWFGFSVAAAGDLNGDGVSEFLIGAREASPNGLTEAGSVSVYSGKNGTLLKRLDGQAARDRFGTSVDAAGDVNRDGTNDFVVGARFAANATGQITGAAYVFSGKDFTQITKITGETVDDWFGGSVASVGDINGDGWIEWVVGAAGADPNGNSNAGRAYVYGLKHNDVAITDAQAPMSARIGDRVNVSYTVANHGEDAASVTTALAVNATRRTSASMSLLFLETKSGNLSYTLASSDFVGGRASLCVKAIIDNVTDNYDSDNVKCLQVRQSF